MPPIDLQVTDVFMSTIAGPGGSAVLRGDLILYDAAYSPFASIFGSSPVFKPTISGSNTSGYQSFTNFSGTAEIPPGKWPAGSVLAFQLLTASLNGATPWTGLTLQIFAKPSASFYGSGLGF